jgi:hypothetical protein
MALLRQVSRPGVPRLPLKGPGAVSGSAELPLSSRGFAPGFPKQAMEQSRMLLAAGRCRSALNGMFQTPRNRPCNGKRYVSDSPEVALHCVREVSDCREVPLFSHKCLVGKCERGDAQSDHGSPPRRAEACRACPTGRFGATAARLVNPKCLESGHPPCGGVRTHRPTSNATGRARCPIAPPRYSVVSAAGGGLRTARLTRFQ